MATNFPGKLLEDLETQNLLELEETKKVLIEIVSSSKNRKLNFSMISLFLALYSPHLPPHCR